MTDSTSSLAAFDAYTGIDVEVAGQSVTLQALTFAQGLRFMRLAERAGLGDDNAAAQIVATFPRAIGLELEDLSEEDFARIFERCFDPGQYAPSGTPTEQQARDTGPGDFVTFTFDDLLADYAAVYRGLPSPDQPWPIVLMLIQRMPRFESRARLRLLDSVSSAIAGAFGAADQVQRQRQRLVREAYPGQQKGPRFVQNMAAKKPDQENP